MEIRQIHYFLALAETRNFTEAAKACNVTQPALSRSIQNLETELGGPLFHRERQHTHLSELGRLMLPYLASVARDTDKARHAARLHLSGETAHLKIGVMCTVGSDLLSRFFAELLAGREGFAIEVTDATLSETTAGLLDGRFEVAVVSTPRPLDEKIAAQPLFSDRFGVVVPACHRFAAMEAVPCAALDGEPYVNRADCEYFAPMSAAFKAMGVGMRQTFSSPRDEWVLAMIRAGLGVGIFPERAFVAVSPDLVYRPIAAPDFMRDVVLATVRGRPHSPAVAATVRAAGRFAWTGHPCRALAEKATAR